MLRRTIKLFGRRKAGSWGRTAKKFLKRIANKASRAKGKRKPSNAG